MITGSGLAEAPLNGDPRCRSTTSWTVGSGLLKPAYTEPAVWENFDPNTMTLCSPDLQAIRPAGEKANVLQVTLPTNFKVAGFDVEKGNEIIERLEKEIGAARFETPEGKIKLPVKLRFYESIFVPLAKWAMLMAGNYRCITDGMRTAREAVHSDLEASRSIYDSCSKYASRSAPHATSLCRSKSTPRPRKASRIPPQPLGP